MFYSIHKSAPVKHFNLLTLPYLKKAVLSYTLQQGSFDGFVYAAQKGLKTQNIQWDVSVRYRASIPLRMQRENNDSELILTRVPNTYLEWKYCKISAIFHTCRILKMTILLQYTLNNLISKRRTALLLWWENRPLRTLPHWFSCQLKNILLKISKF